MNLRACYKFHEDLKKYSDPYFNLQEDPRHYKDACVVDVLNNHISDDDWLGKIGGISWGDQIQIDIPIRTYVDHPGKFTMYKTGVMKALVTSPPDFEKRMKKCGCTVEKAHWHGDNSVHAHAKCPIEKRSCIVREALKHASE